MTLAEPDTDHLLDAFQQGDLSAQDQLFARHRGRLRQMVAVHLDDRLRQRLDLSDVVQETLAKAASRLPGYADTRPVAFYPWLRSIAWDLLVNIHREHLRTQKRSAHREDHWRATLPDESVCDLAAQLVGDVSSPSRMAVRAEIVHRVREAIDQLGAEDRAVIVLRYLEQMPTPEIADVLQLTEAAVRGRQFRAIQKLHRMLNDLNEPGDLDEQGDRP